MKLYNKFLYYDTAPLFTRVEAQTYSLAFETQLVRQWQHKHSFSVIINTLFCGLPSLFQQPLTSKAEFNRRLELFRDEAYKIDRVTRIIQQAYLKKKYCPQRKIRTSMQPFSSFTVEPGFFQIGQLARVWWKKKSIDLTNGARGQIIWQEATTLGSELKKEGYYVFYHAHSYPITMHLELTSSFQAEQLSVASKAQKPKELRRKFRAPAVGELFDNTTEYLKSSIAYRINHGLAMDDNYRETILSCDAIEDNDQAYESCQHFFKSNKSIVDTKTSTGKSSAFFDRSFIKNHLLNDDFQEYSVELFSKAREKLAHFPGYGMIRIIAIAKKTLENPLTNYVWRAHAFGLLCTCQHTPRKFGHAEFVATLNKHQAGQKTRCSSSGSPYPQYRILVKNLDKDPTKQIYTMDCFSKEERQKYNEIYEALRVSIVRMHRLETLSESRSYEALLTALMGIDPTVQALEYKIGLRRELMKNKELISHYLDRLRKDLPGEKASFLHEIS